jgi:TetR/AcrR family transcriptional repressor of mexJK operon
MSPRESAAVKRFERKRAEILAAARRVFTREGYLGTSMDAVAAEAAASKRTVYQYFADKQELFAAAVLDTVDRGYQYFEPKILALAETDDVNGAISQLARDVVVGLTNRELLQMRRLVIAETERFPAIGQEYYQRSWVKTVGLLAQTLATLTQRGLLAVADPERAAYLFTWLVISIPSNRVAFLGDGAVGSPAELDALAEEGARIFLAAYGKQNGSTRRQARPTSRTRNSQARSPAR